MGILPTGRESGVLARLDRELGTERREDGVSDLALIAGLAPMCLRPATYGFGVRDVGGEGREDGGLRGGL